MDAQTPQTTPQVDTPHVDLAELVLLYRQVRDRITQRTQEFEESIKKLTTRREQLAGLLLNILDNTHQESARTVNGTVGVRVESSASVADKSAFMDHVKSTGNFELLDVRANKTAVRDYIEHHEGHTPPGVNFTSRRTVGVTKPRE